MIVSGGVKGLLGEPGSPGAMGTKLTVVAEAIEVIPKTEIKSITIKTRTLIFHPPENCK
jgi:hypothetical protein